MSVWFASKLYLVREEWSGRRWGNLQATATEAQEVTAMRKFTRSCLLMLALLSVALFMFFHLQLTEAPSHLREPPRHSPQPNPDSKNTTQGTADPDEDITPEENSRSAKPEGDSAAARLEHLKEKCQAMPRPPDTPQTPSFERVVVPNVFSACVPNKVGSSSWKFLKENFVKMKTWKLPVNIIVVRNPLTRLESAYRDKFLGGGAISSYTESWRRATFSEDLWFDRWVQYWFLGLIARGSIPPTHWFTERLARMKDVKDTSRFTLPSAEMKHYVTQEYGPRMNKLREDFSNTRFSFEDFLKFVLFSYDMGIMDYHWTPITVLCDPCKQPYDYIIHTESMRDEMAYLLRVFEPPGISEMPHRKSTRDLFYVPKSGYYKYVSNATMQRILNVYRNDFELFGYSI
nr:uncharacterized protein LOC113822396 [Penaeus vannamei]